MITLPSVRIIEGKQYNEGNHVCILHRNLFIEFDSDFSIVSKKCNAKNYVKVLTRLANKIPKVVSLEWFIKHEKFIVPPELIKRFKYVDL